MQYIMIWNMENFITYYSYKNTYYNILTDQDEDNKI